MLRSLNAEFPREVWFPCWTRRRAGLPALVRLRWGLKRAVGLVALFCNTTVSALIYLIFRAVQKNVALVAVISNLAGLACEALHWQPHGIDLGLVFHGGYCVLIGYLLFESAFLPRVFGVLMMFAGCAWLTYLSAPFANRLSPYNLGVALLGEALLMIWLIAKGVILRPQER